MGMTALKRLDLRKNAIGGETRDTLWGTAMERHKRVLVDESTVLGTILFYSSVCLPILVGSPFRSIFRSIFIFSPCIFGLFDYIVLFSS